MISVNLSAHLSGPEPVITAALHTSRDFNDDQMREHPGNCKTLSNGRTSHTRCLISGYFDHLPQFQALFGLRQGLSASPLGRCVCVCVCVSECESLSRVQLFVTHWTLAP